MSTPIGNAVNALYDKMGPAFTAGVLTTQLELAVSMLPKAKREQFVRDFRRIVGNNVDVVVKNILSDKDVTIRWDEVGGPCDPSQERYHSM